jgi:hypothetical protein
MNHLLISTLLIASFCIALLLATPASAAKSCGGGVTVKGSTPCWKAKKIIKEFRKTRKARIQGFTCSGSATVVNCKLQNKRIHWEA